MSVAKFTKSPLAEVVCGVEFIAPRFSSVHFGLYWQTIKERFSQTPLDQPPTSTSEISFLPTLLPPLRRVWFESQDKSSLIQLQANCFYYNWRQLETQDQHSCPQKIYEKFFEEWQNFQDWWSKTEKNELQIMRYELTYVYKIDSNFGWNNSNDYQKIFNFISGDLEDLFLNPSVFSLHLESKLKDELGILTINVNQSRNQQENNQPFIFLDLTANSIETKIDLKEWFDLANKYTVEKFLSLISKEIQEDWRLR